MFGLLLLEIYRLVYDWRETGWGSAGQRQAYEVDISIFILADNLCQTHHYSGDEAQCRGVIDERKSLTNFYKYVRDNTIRRIIDYFNGLIEAGANEPQITHMIDTIARIFVREDERETLAWLDERLLENISIPHAAAGGGTADAGGGN